MSLYKIAGLIVEMECFGEILIKQSNPYLMDTNSKRDMLIHNKAREEYPHLKLEEWEYIKTGFDFSHELLEFNGFCLHSSAVAVDNKSILFSAPPGTGKSTHTSLWQKYFGEDKALIINDDKPALRLEQGIFYVYGTPWSGKTDSSLNVKVPLQGIVFLQQAKENWIRSLNNSEAVKLLIYQSLRPNNDLKKMDKLLTLIDVLLKTIPVYQMGCNVSTEAVKLVYNTINNVRSG